MVEKIKCGLIGLGRLGYWHAVNVATRINNAELQMVCDLDLKKARQVAFELDIPRFTSDFNEIFEDDKIEAVIIAAPTSTHFELLKGASRSGKSIFVEKPITTNLEEAHEITNYLEKNDSFCQVGFMRRYDPAYVEAKKKIEAGEIGDPIYFKGISRDPEAPHESFIKNSGGIFVDVSIHDYDIARFLMNSEITSVAAHGKTIKYPFISKYDDVDQGLSYIEFESGAVGDIEASRNSFYGYDIRAEVIGTKGSIFIGTYKHHNISLLTKNNFSHDILPSFPERFQEAYYIELQDFFYSLERHQPSKVTALDALKSLEVATAATTSFKTQKIISI